MMKELTKELIEKAKGAQNAQELVALAKAENVDLSLDQATEYMKTLHPTSGEVADAELGNVSGGCDAPTPKPPKPNPMSLDITSDKDNWDEWHNQKLGNR